MARKRQIEVYVDDELYQIIDDLDEANSAYFRRLAEEDLGPWCESCGSTGDDVTDYYLENENGYLGHPTFCDECYGRAREEHEDDDVNILPTGAIADA